jgi:hypothetical protein
VSDQVQASAALPPKKVPPVPKFHTEHILTFSRTTVSRPFALSYVVSNRIESYC